MAEKYCDHGYHGAYAATPTWGQAQEGDGTAQTGGTPATVSIDLSAYTAVAGNTIAVGGATLTCVASGATNNQFDAGSGTTLIDNIVTAINRAGNTVTVGAAAAGWPTPKVQDCTFARRNGNFLEIMTRAGSATYNANTNFKVVTTGFTGGAQIDQQFAGGVGGPWSYAVNGVEIGTVWPSGLTRHLYGVIPGTLLAGVYLAADIVHMRSNNKVVTLQYLSTGVILNLLKSQTLLFDDGTVWAGDTGQFSITFTGTYNTNYTVFYANVASMVVKWSSRSGHKWKLTIDQSVGNVNVFSIVASGGTQWIALGFDAVFTAASSGLTTLYLASAQASSALSRTSDFSITDNRTSIKTFFTAGGTSFGAQLLEIANGSITFTAFSAAPPVFFSNPSLSGGTNIVRNMRLSGLTAPMPLATFPAPANYSFVFVAENLEGFDDNTVFAGLIGVTSSQIIRSVTLSGLGPKRNFRHETDQFYTDWFYNVGNPTLDSYLPDGTAYSYRVRWSSSSNAINDRIPAVPARLTATNTLADGTRTITCRIMLDGTYAASITKGHIGLRVSYIDTSGIRRSEMIYDELAKLLGTGTVIAADSGSTWALNSYTGHVARKIEFTSAYPIKQNTDIEAALELLRPAPSADQFLFVNPDLGVV